jgi:hypothetical protein
VLLSAGALAGYVASRTIGLPLFPVLPWQDPFGLASMAAEALFIILGVSVLRTPTGCANTYHLGLLAKFERNASEAPVLVGTGDRPAD